MRRISALSASLLPLLLVACDDGAVSDPAPLPDTGPIPDMFTPPQDRDMGAGGGEDGEFLAPCTDNDDCTSGFCIEIEQEERTACSQRCLENDQCPAGWSCRIVENTPPDVVSICVPRQSRICGLCAGDDDCPGGHCYVLDGVSICGFDCASDDDCADGYTCGDVDGRQTCTPVTGSCSCDAESAGDERLCTRENDFGACIGRETCDPAMGWVGCDAQAPAAEVCNQVDDDCNGFTDDIVGLGEVCEQTVETEGGQTISCAGRLVCTAEAEAPVCTAPTPMVELCNFLDDDCDGQTDEGFELRGEICTVGEGECRRVGVQACSGDGLEVICGAVPGDPVDELCNQVDDDCDGEVDEAFPDLAEPCFAGEGACRRAGALRCADDGSSAVCTAVAAEPSDEVCDGVDNDCDGREDEGFAGLFDPCSTGVGACLRQGFLFCTDDGLGVACTAEAAAPGDETCNGIDDDCDGTIDEGYVGLDQPCAVGIGVCRGAGVTACSADGSEVVCNAQLSPPGVELCNGLDDDCDGTADEEFANLNTACAVGEGICRRFGVNTCSEDGRRVVCDQEPGAAEAESCNNLDDDCDGRTDEAFADLGTSCAAGEGICRRVGFLACNDDGDGVACDAVPGPPADAELCNYQDDTCDGSIDEGFVDGQGRYTTVANCGACGTDCAALWDPGPEVFGVAPRCAPLGEAAVCTFDCLPGFIDADGRPDNGCELVADENAVYVATPGDGGVEDADCGGLEAPCATIGRGLARAAAQRRVRVRVGEGVYRESVTLRNGIDVLGGHDPVTWVRDPAFNVSTIIGSSPVDDVHKRAVVARDIDRPTTFDGFVVNGESALLAGNSYGIYVLDSSNALTISNNRVFAGNGGRGVDGDDGRAGDAGRPGAGGAASFGAQTPEACGPNPGGAGGRRSCDGAAVDGGVGGQAGCPELDRQEGSGAAGDTVPAGVYGAIASGGGGGAGAYSLEAPDENSCTVSELGSPAAAPGAAGRAGADTEGAAGAVASLGEGEADWTGARGAVALGGQAGAGGGGGGAAAGADALWAQALAGVPVAHDIGASGGGGGSGGCGGAGGTGGASGGGSFAIYIAFSGGGPADVLDFPRLLDNELSRGLGGNGGDGGNGGAGGGGGPGGAGGPPGDEAILFMAFCALSAGDGGTGGRGGHGGGGGGGQGGISFDIFVANDRGLTPDYAGQNLFVIDGAVPTHGLGGAGGNSSNVDVGLGEAGDDGASGNLATVR